MTQILIKLRNRLHQKAGQIMDEAEGKDWTAKLTNGIRANTLLDIVVSIDGILHEENKEK